jgi:thiol:disulfide interchange protein
MKSIKQLSITALALLTLTGFASAASGWMTNIDSALKLGKQKNKPVMVEFTGTKWCPPCIMMEDKVFKQSTFTKAASKKFILVKIDIPKPGSSSAKRYQDIMRKYRVTGVPTILLFGEDGREFSRFGAAEFPSVEAFLAKLDLELEKKEMD